MRAAPSSLSLPHIHYMKSNAFCLSFEHTKLRPLHWLYPLPGKLIPQSLWPTSAYLSALSSKFTSSERHLLTTYSKVALHPHLWHFLFFLNLFSIFLSFFFSFFFLGYFLIQHTFIVFTSLTFV